MDLWEVSKMKASYQWIAEHAKGAADDEVAKTGVRRSVSDSARSSCGENWYIAARLLQDADWDNMHICGWMCFKSLFDEMLEFKHALFVRCQIRGLKVMLPRLVICCYLHFIYLCCESWRVSVCRENNNCIYKILAFCRLGFRREDVNVFSAWANC